jgi:hypothetical protein
VRQQRDEVFDQATYDTALARAYEQHPPRDLLARRVAHCEGGA